MHCQRHTHRSIIAAAFGLVAFLFCLAPFAAHAQASAPKTKDTAAAADAVDEAIFSGDIPALEAEAGRELKDAAVRLPMAAILGTVLAMRPRRRSQGPRSVLVVQTQIMLAVVGAVIMLVVGNSLSRAFGIVGAAGLVKYRSTIDDPKEAVVMLCALGAGLASGVGLYMLAPFATVFMTAVLWVVEYFEPSARKTFDLVVKMKGACTFRPQIEGVLTGFRLDFELLTESDEVVRYSISAPVDVRTRDVSDTIRLLSTDEEVAIDWADRKPKR